MNDSAFCIKIFGKNRSFSPFLDSSDLALDGVAILAVVVLSEFSMSLFCFSSSRVYY